MSEFKKNSILARLVENTLTNCMLHDVKTYGADNWENFDAYLLEQFDTTEDELIQLGVRVSQQHWDALR